MQALNLAFIGTMIAIAAIDIKTFYVPIWSLVIIGLLAIIKGFAPVNLFYGFALMAFSVYFCDFILQRGVCETRIDWRNNQVMDTSSLGGGDHWIGVAMCCFMGFDKFLIAYMVAALVGSIAMVTVYRDKRHLDVPYAPYLCFGAIWALLIGKI